MRIEFHRTGAERKELVNALGEILGIRPKYKGIAERSLRDWYIYGN